MTKYREADMQSDLSVWRVLKCPAGGMSLGIVTSHYEFSLEDELSERIALLPEEGHEINHLSEGAWQPL